MPSSAVFDASTVVRWLVDDPLTPAAIEAGQTFSAIAPMLIGSELANAMRGQVKAGLYEAEWCLAQMRRLPQLIVLKDERELWPQALRLAVERDHAAYDCVYVAMAITLALPLITADMKLARKFADLPGLEVKLLQDWTA